ncbi:MAG: hypothetical protein KJ718_01015 [Nanoarchaeota archaeon]|nr:hypothetical protein [Nanoarchaeota archaeon]MBU1051116.1 hypothetical protein [Nanoarchaeota archaeon]MBU1988406.1 hypothetical protein [Nanoarchaeota archaeon]
MAKARELVLMTNAPIGSVDRAVRSFGYRLDARSDEPTISCEYVADRGKFGELMLSVAQVDKKELEEYLENFRREETAIENACTVISSEPYKNVPRDSSRITQLGVNREREGLALIEMQRKLMPLLTRVCKFNAHLYEVVGNLSEVMGHKMIVHPDSIRTII